MEKLGRQTRRVHTAVEKYGSERVLAVLILVKRYGIDNILSAETFFNNHTELEILKELYPEATLSSYATPNGDFYENYQYTPLKN